MRNLHRTCENCPARLDSNVNKEEFLFNFQISQKKFKYSAPNHKPFFIFKIYSANTTPFLTQFFFLKNYLLTNKIYVFTTKNDQNKLEFFT
ncbi:hypothetical protein BpHYR1_042604 [Brachionus plicatilis]|uniref:Uncharacterized protein n=1 Tax=Brachionus plicatilis TaxID=10195 RepID=A0A3M7PZC4_BRAPC|nr:hypothetical protein BpHYR1_042604 [Brachionus plicatilis]